MNTIFIRFCWAVAAIVALVVALAPPPKPAADFDSSRLEGWLVPRPDKATNSAAIAANLVRTSAALWGGQADAVSVVDTLAASWRLAGVTGQANTRFAVVQFGDDRILPLKAGDMLPDGTPIVEVREGGLCVTLSGKRRFLPLSGQTIPIVW